MESLTRSIITLILIICTILPLSNALRINPKTHVVITNNLGGGLKVTLHCKSADDDLGAQLVEDGHTYQIVFHPNFFETTLYYCSFSWIGGSLTTDVYRARRDISRCGILCQWTITRDGVSGKDKHGAVDLYYKWK